MRRVGHLALSAALALSVVLLLQLLSPVAALSKVAPTPNSVVVNADGTMTVDGSPFKIKGIGECTAQHQQQQQWHPETRVSRPVRRPAH